MSLNKATVTTEELLEELHRRLSQTTQAALAKKLKIAAPLISNILSGHSNPCGKVLKWLGYQRVVIYRRI